MAFFNNRHEKQSQSAQDSFETWKLTASGVVQGVGFRWSVLNLANKMGLTGNVCNNSDQTVTITLQTSLDHINQFIKELPQNVSPYAQISTIKKEKLANVAKMHGFHVLY